MSAQTKNYMEGPDKWVINGALAFGTGATVTGLAADPLLPATAEQLGGVMVGSGLEVTENGVLSAAVATDETAGAVIVGDGLEIADGVLSVSNPLVAAENQADCEAEDVAGVVTAFNALLAKLKAAGLMEADEE